MPRLGAVFLLSSISILLAVTIACSKKGEEISAEKSSKTPTAAPPAPPPASITPVDPPDPTVAPGKVFWLGQSNSYVVNSFDASKPKADSPIDRVDLKFLFPTAAKGGVTALSFLDANTLLAFVDPGSSDESIVAINLKELSPVKWYSNSSYSNQSVISLVPFIPTKTALSKITKIFAPNTIGFDMFLLPTDTTPPIKLDRNNPIYAQLANLENSSTCPDGTIKGMTLISDAKATSFAMFVLVARIDDVKPGGLHSISASFDGGPNKPKCNASFNYTATATGTTTAADIPHQVSYLPGLRRAFVLYHNEISGDKIVSYGFDTSFAIASPSKVSDGGHGTKIAAMIPYTNQSLLLAGDEKIQIITTAGKDTGHWSGFPTDISAIAFYNPDIAKTPAPTPKPAATVTSIPSPTP